MAPTPSSKFNSSTPSAKSVPFHHQWKTPQSKHRLNFPKETPAEHPVEVIGRIRNHPEQTSKPSSALQINGDGKTLRVRTENTCRDFTLDGVSLSEEDDLEGFYKKFVESRINGVKLGQKCTIMMYGPTGSGKSHTMFGWSKQPGIVYNSLKGILGEEEDGEKMGLGTTFVQVTVLEIYNEEIYDLLPSTNNGGGGGFSLGWTSKGGGGSASKVRLEVMGKKAKNATFISGNEAGKIMKEIQKVEKRRTIKSTLCNERSSRSHCMIILDVPTVGGRLMLVDMAGSENIEQAGQYGAEAKMQTAKINQGNIALKRVVESIANGDSHVPFRDSKLTMLLQDSFEDDESKILMILCASPDPKELHKTIATLEYGAKAKCIVRGPRTPVKHEGAEDPSSAVISGARIAALDQFIYKLQVENKLKENERDEVRRKLKQKEEEVTLLTEQLAAEEGSNLEASEEIINAKVKERVLILKSEFERKARECQQRADDIIEAERQRMEERMFQQQQEAEMLRKRLEEIEVEACLSKAGSESVVEDMEGGSFMKKLLEACSEDSDMVKSMDVDRSIDMEMTSRIHEAETNAATPISGSSYLNWISEGTHSFTNKACLTTVYEEEDLRDHEEGNWQSFLDDEVQKEVIEEKRMIVTPVSKKSPDYIVETKKLENPEDASASRQLILQNIFTLCGNYRELSHHNTTTPMPARTKLNNIDSIEQQKNIFNELLGSSGELKMDEDVVEQKLGKSRGSEEDAKSLGNHNPLEENCKDIAVHVQWEASKENPGKLATIMLNVTGNSSLAELRKLIEIHLGGEQQQQGFAFLDPSGMAVPEEKEATTWTSKLPTLNDQVHLRVAHLRAVKAAGRPAYQPLCALENKQLPATPDSHDFTKKGGLDCFSPEMPQHLSSTPFITVRRR